MSDLENGQDPIEVEGPEAFSLGDELAGYREEIEAPRLPLELEIPGYRGKLVAKYKRIDYDEIKEISKRGAKMSRAHDEEAPLKVQADTLIAACVGIFTPVDKELVPLEDAMPELDSSKGPVRFDRRLAQAVKLNMDTDKAREVVFGVMPDPVLMGSHYSDYEVWRSSATGDAEADF